MKVRIKVVKKNNGTKLYIPQVKEDFNLDVLIRLFVNTLTILFTGKRYFKKYSGLYKLSPSYSQQRINEIFGMMPGNISICGVTKRDFGLLIKMMRKDF